MRHSAECKDCLGKLQLYADNELTPLEAAGVLDHAQGCPACRAALTSVENMSKSIRLNADHYRAPSDLAARVAALAPRPAMSRKRFAIPAFSGAALALSLMLYLSTPSADDRLADEMVAIQVRALQAQHLTDVASTDQHTVKPWFAGRVDFSPPVHDFAAQGYPLDGGRLDYLNHQPAAALVYHRHKHVINVVVTPAPDGLADIPMHSLSRRGYNIVLWRKNHLSFAAVSDVNAAELGELCKLIADNT